MVLNRPVHRNQNERIEKGYKVIWTATYKYTCWGILKRTSYPRHLDYFFLFGRTIRVSRSNSNEEWLSLLPIWVHRESRKKSISRAPRIVQSQILHRRPTLGVPEHFNLTKTSSQVLSSPLICTYTLCIPNCVRPGSLFILLLF